MDEKLMALLTCYDFRTEREKLGLSKWRLYNELLPELKKTRYKFHLSYLRPVGIGHLYAVIRDRERWKRFRDKYVAGRINSVEEMAEVPLNRFVHKLYVFSDGTVGVLYYAPKELRDELIARLDGFYDEVRDANVYPVMNCQGRLWPDVSPEEAEKMGREALAKLSSVEEFRSRNRLLDYMILVVMEDNPVLMLRELTDLMHIAKARFLEESGEKLELNIRYVRRHYRELSKRYSVGRIYIFRPAVYMIFEVGKKYKELLYGLAAATLGSVHYIDLGDAAFSTLPAESHNDAVKFILSLTHDLVRLVIKLRGWHMPAPFEMYDPITNSWSLDKPVINDLASMVKKYRLVKA
jgi:hypothetical protein